MVLEILFISLIIYYLVIAFCLFTQWLKLIQKDATSNSQVFYKLLLIVITIFWPFIVPIAYLELLIRNKKNKAIIGLITEQVIEDGASVGNNF